MGSIELKYEIRRLDVSPDELVNEIEYGTTFALENGQETVIPLRGGSLSWLKWDCDKHWLVVDVDSSFLSHETFFEKFMAAFIYNLTDFGDLILTSIGVRGDSPVCCRPGAVSSDAFATDLVLGTILKPYYHLSLEDKLEQVAQFVHRGLGVIKEDETYMVSEQRLRREAEAIQAVMVDSAIYVPNVTHYVHNFALIEHLIDSGIRVVMLDFLVCGFRPILNLKQRFPKLGVWGHRVGYSSIHRLISMEALGVLALLSGISYLHLGTPRSHSELERRSRLADQLLTIDPGFRPVFTKTTPTSLREMISDFGRRAIYLACGSIRDISSGKIDWQKVDEWVSSVDDE